MFASWFGPNKANTGTPKAQQHQPSASNRQSQYVNVVIDFAGHSGRKSMAGVQNGLHALVNDVITSDNMPHGTIHIKEWALAAAQSNGQGARIHCVLTAELGRNEQLYDAVHKIKNRLTQAGWTDYISSALYQHILLEPAPAPPIRAPTPVRLGPRRAAALPDLPGRKRV